jgi:FecR protein
VLRGGTELTLLATGTETVVQRLGHARYQVEPGSVSDFLVETPYLVIGIKGTIFEGLVNEAGAEVEVSEGLVEVTTPDGRFHAVLARGQSARVGAAAGSAPEVQSDSGGTVAPVPQDSTGSVPPEEVSPPEQVVRAAAAPQLTEPEIDGALSPLTSAVRWLDRLWSGIGERLSDVDIVYDERLPTQRRGTLVRTLNGGIASVGSGAQGDSGGGGSAGGSAGGGSSGGSSSSGAGGGAGSNSSGAGGGSSSSGGGGGNSGSGSAGGGLSGAVGGVSSAVGGAVGGGLGSAVGGLGKGVSGAVGGRGKGRGQRGKR